MTTDTTPRLDSLVCWMASDLAAALVDLLRDELTIDVRVEFDANGILAYVAESDSRVANAAFLGFQLGRDFYR
jgi:hypothetical protein